MLVIQKNEGPQALYFSMKVARDTGASAAWTTDIRKADKYIDQKAADNIMRTKVPQHDRADAKVVPHG